MSDSNSQNASEREYADEVEVGSSTASSYDSSDLEAETSSRVSRSEVESRALDPEITEESETYGRGKFPRTVIATVTEKYQARSTTSQNELMAGLPAHENAPLGWTLPVSMDAPLTSSPSSEWDRQLLFLNNEDVQQHNCLLTQAEIDEIFTLLSGQMRIHRNNSRLQIIIGRKNIRRSGSSSQSSSWAQVSFRPPYRATSQKRGFGSMGARKPHPKVTLGGNKDDPPPATVPDQSIPACLPLGTARVVNPESGLPMSRAYSKRGKEKATD
nr:hypothetical protein Iba_chr13cCG12020 [Ipomoea batatas]